MSKVTTGLKELDSMLDGGFPDKTSILLSGGAGTGKTLVALNFLIEGAVLGEKCCYVSLNESREDILRACDGIKSLKRVGRHLDKNLAITYVEMGKPVTLEYFSRIFSSYPKVDRLVIDNLNKLLIHASDKREYRIMLSELVKYLKEKIKCSLLICETSDDEIDSGNGEAFECDGVVHISFLELEEKPKRTLEVSKLRYTSFEPRIPRELIIDDDGLRITKTQIV